MTYTLKYKMPSQWFWRSEKVIGHGYTAEGKLALDLEDGSILELPGFMNIAIKVCPKWKINKKNEINKDAGQRVID